MSQHNESKQHSQNYIAQVCEQVRWKKAHDAVSEELLAHIEDQAEVYREEGYTEDEAEYLAVEQMGDPVLAGSQFDKVYKPRMEWNVLCLAGTIILLGTVLRLTLLSAAGEPIYCGNELLKLLVALSFLVLGYCMDYTVLLSGKLLIVFSGIVAVLTAHLSKIVFIDSWYTPAHYTIPLWILLLCATLYRVRHKGKDGFLILFAEIMIMLWIFIFLFDSNLSGAMIWLGSCFVLALYALQIDWFGCSKRWLWMFSLYPLIILYFIFSMPHRINRVLAMFDPFSDPMGSGYVQCQIVDAMCNANLFGSGGVTLAYLAKNLPDMHDYILTLALSHWGWVSILIILLSYGLFFAFCFMATRKVKSEMGKLMMVAIISCWVMQFMSYFIVNFTTLQMSTYPLLFVQGGWMRIINLFLLGILLSVYKTGAVQKDSQPVVKMRKMKTKEQFFS